MVFHLNFQQPQLVQDSTLVGGVLYCFIEQNIVHLKTQQCQAMAAVLNLLTVFSAIKFSTSLRVRGSACFCLDPIPVLCNLFISASKEDLKSENAGSLKKSISGLPLYSTTNVIQCVWWKFHRRITFFLNSYYKSTKPVIQPRFIE